MRLHAPGHQEAGDTVPALTNRHNPTRPWMQHVMHEAPQDPQISGPSASPPSRVVRKVARVAKG